MIYLLFVIIAIPFLGSCGDDDEDDEGTKIPDGWVKNNDLETLGKHSWYLHRSGNDSIKINFFQYEIVYDYGGMGYHFYRKNNQGKYNKIEFSYLLEAYSIEKNKEKKIFGQGYKLKNYGMRYELVDDATVIVYDLPEMGSFEQGIEFKAVNESKYNDKNLLRGGWYNSQVVDSTVMVFEDENVKEYLFIRGSSVIQDFWEYGDYWATRVKSYLQSEYLGAVCDLNFKGSSENDCIYEINGDKLTLYWKDPRKTTTYTRIKQ
ncbi:MAG: hypothetical protein ACK5M3_16090 [Dysgonomonas sp.]